jgi:hypothetical protein
MFEKVIGNLVKGKQPSKDDIVKIGYLHRTTAVYGNGKFGMADFKFLIKNTSLDFPFAAQMLTVYLIREFSYYQINHIAKCKNKEAINLSDNSKRNIGIGNSTGLGMAPFLINHSKPVGHWISARENSLLEILQLDTIFENKWNEFHEGLKLATGFFEQSYTDNEFQKTTNIETSKELQAFGELLKTIIDLPNWKYVVKVLHSMNANFQTQEAIISLILELYPEICDSFFVNLNHNEDFQLIPQMSLKHIMTIIESHYSWIKQFDFTNPSDDYYFWYYSENKDEPRLGVKTEDAGIENQMPLGIAKDVNRCKKLLEIDIENGVENIAQFLIQHPLMRSIVKRIQYMGQDEKISDIHINTLGKDILPTDLLRCKLALLGATKFDPKSDKWVKVTFFQGCPLSTDLSGSQIGVKHLFPIIK